jgi:hypothetical protein
MNLLHKLLLALLLVIPLTVAFGASADSAVSIDAPQPTGDTIVDITGDAANGFEIYHYDGTGVFPPTDSEARAECGEYDRRVDRVRCRTEVRTWYRDLAATKQALDWAHEQSPQV